jgi:hypothetical protein
VRRSPERFHNTNHPLFLSRLCRRPRRLFGVVANQGLIAQGLSKEHAAIKSKVERRCGLTLLTRVAHRAELTGRAQMPI